MKDSNENWFSDWFNTSYYHMLYKNRDESEAELFIEHLLNFLNLDASAHVLDVACGKGRHSFKTNQLGYNVTGIDLSENSIEIAQKKANNSLSFAVHDMRDPYKNNAFDVVLNLFTSFGYINEDSDNERVLKAVSANLKAEGTFVLDFLNSKKVVAELVPYEEKNINGITFKISKTFENHVIQKKIEFTDHERDYSFTERVTAFSKSDLAELFEKTSLKISNYFGNYDLDEFNEATSERLIMVAKK